jgi:hypothetical protein
MRTSGFPVMIDLNGNRFDAGFRAPSTEKPVLIALQLRDRGWDPYRVSFDPHAGTWVALVLHDSKTGAAAEDAKR